LPSKQEKRQALDTWEQDARQMLTASNEGMEGDNEGLDQSDTHRLAEVVRAKAKIGAKPKDFNLVRLGIGDEASVQVLGGAGRLRQECRKLARRAGLRRHDCEVSATGRGKSAFGEVCEVESANRHFQVAPCPPTRMNNAGSALPVAALGTCSRARRFTKEMYPARKG
jgi:hypothetical protein